MAVGAGYAPKGKTFLVIGVTLSTSFHKGLYGVIKKLDLGQVFTLSAKGKNYSPLVDQDQQQRPDHALRPVPPDLPRPRERVVGHPELQPVQDAPGAVQQLAAAHADLLHHKCGREDQADDQEALSSARAWAMA